MSAGQQAQADPAVLLAAVQLVELVDVAAEAPGARAKQRGQPEAQQQVQGAVRGVLLQEAQAAGQPTAQRVLAQQEQPQPLGALGALGGGRRGEKGGRDAGGSGCLSPEVGGPRGCEGAEALFCRNLEPEGTLGIIPKEGIFPGVPGGFRQLSV